MTNDNYKDLEDVAKGTAQKIAKQFSLQPKKNYPTIQPRVKKKGDVQLTKINISLFSFNWKAKS